MALVVVLVVLFAVVFTVSSPLWRPRAPSSGMTDGDSARSADELADLEAARDAKYREIRDAELDHETGKLSDADFAAIEGALRAEAGTILRDLDAARARSPQTTN